VLDDSQSPAESVVSSDESSAALVSDDHGEVQGTTTLDDPIFWEAGDANTIGIDACSVNVTTGGEVVNMQTIMDMEKTICWDMKKDDVQTSSIKDDVQTIEDDVQTSKDEEDDWLELIRLVEGDDCDADTCPPDEHNRTQNDTYTTDATNNGAASGADGDDHYNDDDDDPYGWSSRAAEYATTNKTTTAGDDDASPKKGAQSYDDEAQPFDYEGTDDDEDDDEDTQKERRAFEGLVFKMRQKSNLKLLMPDDMSIRKHQLAASELKNQQKQCEQIREIMFWEDAAVATLGQVQRHIYDTGKAVKRFYVGGTINVKRRWTGWVGGPRGSCRGHRADWEKMLVIKVCLAGTGPDIEQMLINFAKGSSHLSDVCTNKAPDARGLRKTGTTFMYMVWDGLQEEDLEDMIE
jgi:hypothetical protein